MIINKELTSWRKFTLSLIKKDSSEPSSKVIESITPHGKIFQGEKQIKEIQLEQAYIAVLTHRDIVTKFK